MKNWFLWFAVGVFSVVGGLFAFANPLSATLTAELVAGWLFLAIGLLTLFSAFQDQGWGARIWAILLGCVITVFGFNLLAHPLEGVLSLTFGIAILLMIIGVFRLVIAFSPMGGAARGLMILSGLVSVVLSLMIFANYPWSSAVVLGVYLSVELIFNGMSLIALSLYRKDEATA